MIGKIDYLKHYVKNVVKSIVCSIDHDCFAQYLYQSSSFFYNICSIEKLIMFYIFKANISNWARIVSENIHLVDLNVFYILFTIFIVEHNIDWHLLSSDAWKWMLL